MSSRSEEFDAAFPSLTAVAFRVAFRILGDQGDAEDVAQEALARALIRWPKIHEYATPWVATTASNLAIGVWRRRRHAPLPRPDRHQVDEHRSDRLELVRLLRDLPRRQREVVVLRYLADMSEQDVARALGCAPGTVKQHAHRGLRSLRLAIEPSTEGTI